MLFFFFFNDTATTEIYTLSLHDALPIYFWWRSRTASDCGTKPRLLRHQGRRRRGLPLEPAPLFPLDRKSTRLNSSHSQISYAVFCLKKKQTSELAHKLDTSHGSRTSRLH